MPLSTNVHSYDDIRVVLDAALEAGGARYELPDPGKAVYWRARAYYYRTLLLKLAAERLANVPGTAPSTPYDHMKLSLEKGDNVVVIEFIKPQGKLTGLDGKPLAVKSQLVKADEDEEELIREAERLAKELGVDE